MTAVLASLRSSETRGSLAWKLRRALESRREYYGWLRSRRCGTRTSRLGFWLHVYRSDRRAYLSAKRGLRYAAGGAK